MYFLTRYIYVLARRGILADEVIHSATIPLICSQDNQWRAHIDKHGGWGGGGGGGEGEWKEEKEAEVDNNFHIHVYTIRLKSTNNMQTGKVALQIKHDRVQDIPCITGTCNENIYHQQKCTTTTQRNCFPEVHIPCLHFPQSRKIWFMYRR